MALRRDSTLRNELEGRISESAADGRRDLAAKAASLETALAQCERDLADCEKKHTELFTRFAVMESDMVRLQQENRAMHDELRRIGRTP